MYTELLWHLRSLFACAVQSFMFLKGWVPFANDENKSISSVGCFIASVSFSLFSLSLLRQFPQSHMAAEKSKEGAVFQVLTKGLWCHHAPWMPEARSCIHRPSGLPLKAKGKADGAIMTWTEILSVFPDLVIGPTSCLHTFVLPLPWGLMPKSHWLIHGICLETEICGKIRKEQVEFSLSPSWNLYQKVQGPT